MIIDVNFFDKTHSFFKDVSKEYLLPNLGNLKKDQISEKSDNSLVTQYDLIIENELIQYFKEKGFVNIISEENIDEETINEHLYTENSKNVDLLIRTGGEFRVSNFLLWQISYAELNFQKVLWPDFKKYHFLNAIIDYQNRTRRFGKIHA